MAGGFKLIVMTLEKTVFKGEVNSVTVRTTAGDVGILRNHADYVAPIDVGKLKIKQGDEEKIAAVANGLIKVMNGDVTILIGTCEWADEIDVERAKLAEIRAREYMKSPTKIHTEEVARLKLQRALNRIDIGLNK